MLSKIFSFSSRKTGKKIVDGNTEPNCRVDYRRTFPYLEPSQIRVLVFRDCDRKGKTLLFDSKVVNKHESQDSPASKSSGPEAKRTPTSKTEHGYNVTPRSKATSQNWQQSHDAKMLGEMIFGSVAMTYKGSTVKVHVIRSPHQLLLSKVFSLKPRIVMPNCGCSENGESFVSTSSQIDSMLEGNSRMRADCVSLSSQNNSPKDSSLLSASSNPMAVPGTTPSIIFDPEEDSGFMASIESNSVADSVTSLYTPPSPCGSYQRRLHRSQVTSIDCGFNRKREEPEEISPMLRRRPKIGLGIIFPLSSNDDKNRVLQGFFFAHFPLFESHVHRLRLAVERACFSKKSFSTQVCEAVVSFCECISNLLMVPRLKEPVWLNMMSLPDHRTDLCEKFMEQFNGCLSLCNNRETDFFLASLLTAVMTYHLAWVPTVMPAGAAPSRAYLDKHSSKTLDLLAQSHPYNPLWAQLSDLYGAIGYPLKLARTVVVGQNSKLVNQVLYILSYFIRCTEVFEHTLTIQEVVEPKKPNCCFCWQQQDDAAHEHSICSACIEKSGLSICPDCRKLILQDLDPCIRSTQTVNSSKEKHSELLDQFDGLPSCPKCGLLQRDFLENELIRVNSTAGTCGCMPKWAVAKELRHFVKDISYCERSETFRCYCCDKVPVKEPEDIIEGESSFKCYCLEEDCSHCSSRTDTHKCAAQDISKLCPEGENGFDNFSTFMRLLSNDQFCPKVECKCARDELPICTSDSNSCLSIDMDSIHSISEKTEVESVASYGRSGSADSGFHQIPMNLSCAAQQKEHFECLNADILEDEFGPRELPLPGLIYETDSHDTCSKSNNWKKSNNFGRSLFAGMCDSYHPDFVLQGVPTKDFLSSLSRDLRLSLQHSVVDDPLTDAVCIVADTDNWTCELITAKKGKKLSPNECIPGQPIEVSNLVLSMLTSVSGLWDVKMSAEFCLMHLEDRLKEIYLKSKVISEWLRDKNRPIGKAELARTLGIDDNDILLLLAVTSAHSPQGIAYIRH